MKKPGEEERRFGKEGQTYIVFTSCGNVMLETEGEKAEHRALRKNFFQEVTAGGVTLTVGDFSHIHTGVPSYSESLATLLNSIVHASNSEEEAQKALNQLKSVVITARRRALDDQKTHLEDEHSRFRGYVIDLSKLFGRPPTQCEIRLAMFPDTQPEKVKDRARAIKRLCDANKLGWLQSGGDLGRP